MRSERALRTWLAPAAIGLGGLVLFYREFLFSGFDLVAGERGDARFITFIHENAYQSLIGRSTFLSPPMYFPAQGTLSYSDAFLLDALVYVPARWLGADPFLAGEITYAALSLIGFALLTWLLVGYARVRPWLAGCAGFVFAYSNALFVGGNHAQLRAVELTPLVVILLLQAVRDSGRQGRRAVICAGCGGLLAGLMFATGYYVAWFQLLLLCLAAPLAGWLVAGRRIITGFASAGGAPTAIGFAAGFVAGVIPFFVIYWPFLRSPHSFAFFSYVGCAPTLADYLNVGPGNLVWGPVEAQAGIASTSLLALETSLAVTPTVLAGFILSAIAIGRGARLTEPSERGVRAVSLAVFVAVGLLYLLVVRGSGHSLFWFAWLTIPGAGAIRCAARFQVLANGCAVAVAAIVLDRAMTGWAGTWKRWALLAAMILAMAEQVNLSSSSQVSRAAENAVLDPVPPPPEGCRAFYVAERPGAPDDVLDESFQQIDAMLLAERLGVPTLNGYSAWAPEGWTMGHIHDPAYEPGALAWAARNGIADSVCRVDIPTGTWSRPARSSAAMPIQ
ncbi:MAG TPA: hypothetical protein VKS60_06325 [Stellaceae bacterium]|nr:hypothetical protein [Stellaceae bacterium]